MTLNIKKDIPLAPLTTFGIGGNAKFFVEVGSTEELTEAVDFAKQSKLPIFILGGGSNILISDDGLDGLVIKINIHSLWINDIASRSSRLSTGILFTVGAGEIWDDVVASAVEKNLSGIENLSLIPGTVGGAVYQNIGAYGVELKDVLNFVTAYDTATGSIVRLSKEECRFGYRSSIFQSVSWRNKNLIVLEAGLSLSEDFKPNLKYPDLQKRFEGRSPSLGDVRNAVIEIRKNKIYYPKELGNAGSFFKNPVMPLSTFHALLSNYPDLKGKETSSGLTKLSAAQLIEKAGWKGRRLGNVGVADKHALVLVNYGGGTTKELIELEKMIVKDVKKKFGVELEREVELVSRK